MKAKVLVDNIAAQNAASEWGLSIYIEYDDKRILLDAGATNLFATNAKYYGLDLSSVDYAILSHAHYDHSGGMKRFFELNDSALFYLQEPCACYAKKFIFRKYIGIPKNITAEYPDRIKIVSGDCEICPGVHLIAHHASGLEAIGKKEMMYKKVGAKLSPDDFSHEQSLVFDTERGLVVFNSCSHGGVDTIIDEVSVALPGKKVYGLIGGFHLFNKSAENIHKVANMIREANVEYVCTGHCTGDRAYKILKEDLGDTMHQLSVGLEIEL